MVVFANFDDAYTACAQIDVMDKLTGVAFISHFLSEIVRLTVYCGVMLSNARKTIKPPAILYKTCNGVFSTKVPNAVPRQNYVIHIHT